MTVEDPILLSFVSERGKKNRDPRIGERAMKTSGIRNTGIRLIRTSAGIASVICCILAHSGCATTESIVLMPDEDGSYKKVKISKMVLKNGDKIDCSDKVVYLDKSRGDSAGMFAVTGKYSMVAGGGEDLPSSLMTQYIPLSEVLLVYADKERIDELKTTGSVIAVLAGTAAGLLVIAFTLGIGGFANP